MTDTQTPERIWATYNDALGKPMWEGGSVTIFEQPQVGRFVEYIRLDLYAAVVAERDQLKAELERLGNAKAGNDKNNLSNIEYWQRKCLAAEAKLTELEKHRA